MAKNVHRTVLISLLLTTALPSAAATVHPEIPSYWYTIGGDPCEGNENCTYQWALNEAMEKRVFPAVVAAAFQQQLDEGVPPAESEVCRGDVFFMTFGAVGIPRFISRMIAAFSDVECTPTAEWAFTDPDTGRTFIFFKVHACGNWGGYEATSEIPGGGLQITPPSLNGPEPVTLIPDSPGGNGGGNDNYLPPDEVTPPDFGDTGGGGGGSDQPGGGGGGTIPIPPTPAPPAVIPLPGAGLLLLSCLLVLVSFRRRQSLVRSL